MFWMHHAFQTAFSKIPGMQHITIGPKNSCPDWAVGALSLSPKMRQRLSHFPLVGLGVDLLRIQNTATNCFDEGSRIHLHVYDGGFREYIIVLKLLSTNSHWTASFNFGNWLDPWSKLLLGLAKSPRGRFAKLFSRIFENPRILKYTETHALARLFPLDKVGVNPYPSFSAIPSEETAVRPAREMIRNRPIDMVFFPESEEELEFSLVIIDSLASKVNRSLSLAIQPRWELELSEYWAHQLKSRNIRQFHRILPIELYVQMFRDSKIVVLPYKGLGHYRYQGSGRLRDAIAMGCRVLVPEGTALEELAETYASVSSVTLKDVGEVSNLLSHMLELPKISGSVAFTPYSSATEIVRASEELMAPEESIGKSSFGMIETLALGSAYLRLDWYQPFLGIAKAVGVPNHLLSEVRRILV